MTTHRHLTMYVAEPRPVPSQPKRSSYVLYRGPSRFTGEEIVVILTGARKRSSNSKTGAMAQVYILAVKEAPQEAQRSGADRAVCGTCPQRPKNGGHCYVMTFQGPLSTWKANKDQPVTLEAGLAALRASGLHVRNGAYGDPAAVPQHINDAIHAASPKGATGYTHAWRHVAVTVTNTCMASVETEAEAHEAHARGLRTFRVLHGVPPKKHPTALAVARTKLLPNEILCPAYSHGTQCADCGLCDGANGKKNIAIPLH